jgi:hypothetical protein
MPRSRWLIAAAALLFTFGLSVPAANAAVTTTDAAFTYTGTWNVVTGTQHEHWTAQNGATARINFTTSTAGQTVTLRGVKGATSGNHTANAVIDAATPVVLDEGTGTGTTQNAVVGTSGPLPAGNHTLTLTVTRPEFSIQNLSLTAGSFGGPGYTPGGGTGGTGGTGTNSGTSAPVGDLPGWHQVYVDNFEAAASSVNLTTVYPRLFPYTDNSSYARANLSVSGGTLNINEGSDGRGAAVVITAPSTGWGQTYGRYDIEFRADAANNFGSAFLLWPDSEVWGRRRDRLPRGQLRRPDPRLQPLPGRQRPLELPDGQHRRLLADLAPGHHRLDPDRRHLLPGRHADRWPAPPSPPRTAPSPACSPPPPRPHRRRATGCRCTPATRAPPAQRVRGRHPAAVPGGHRLGRGAVEHGDDDVHHVGRVGGDPHRHLGRGDRRELRDRRGADLRDRGDDHVRHRPGFVLGVLSWRATATRSPRPPARRRRRSPPCPPARPATCGSTRWASPCPPRSPARSG